MNAGWSLALDGSEVSIVLRLLLAVVAGGAVGWNRHREGKPAGVGTHALVALGAALFVVLPAARGSEAVTRVIQGVAAGVGFLGAGEIFRESSTTNRIQGLTSASALWVTAALGIIAATASAGLALTSTGLVLLVLLGAPWLEHLIARREKDT